VTTSSSAPALACALDTPILVYSLLDGHPASAACDQLLRGQSGWFTSPLVLLESYAILTKVYDVAVPLATQKLAQTVLLPIQVVDLGIQATLDVWQSVATSGLDSADAALLQLTQNVGAKELATDDQRLMQACKSVGITARCPLDSILRQQVAVWEAANLPSKGLPRILRRIHQWLVQAHPQAAVDFWSQTGGGAHIP